MPSTYPNLTSLEAVNPNSLLLVWLPLTSQFANGIIENYVIRVYERNAITGVGLRNIEVSTNTTHQNIDDLHPYYNYLINLAAETVIGIGPFSNDYNITTPEDGIFTKINIYLIARGNNYPQMQFPAPLLATSLVRHWTQPEYTFHGAHRITKHTMESSGTTKCKFWKYHLGMSSPFRKVEHTMK